MAELCEGVESVVDRLHESADRSRGQGVLRDAGQVESPDGGTHIETGQVEANRRASLDRDFLPDRV